jgi:16S rRNA (guanine966-N2)-methyltransferase
VSIRIYGNRQIQTPPGLATRPTPSRVRQALFNIWQGRVRGCAWLDLCAGSGAMTAEALCRGAALAVAIEESRSVSLTIQQNCQKLPGAAQLRVLTGLVQQVLPTLAGQQFNLIYCDPPYQSNLYGQVLGAIEAHQLLACGGEIALEHGVDRDLSTELLSANLEICRRKTYGSVALTFYGHKKAAPLTESPSMGISEAAVDLA